MEPGSRAAPPGYIHHALANPPQPATAAVSDARLDVTLPNNLAPGFYTIAVEIVTPHGTITSNEMGLAVAPVITTAMPLVVARVAGTATITIVSSVAVLLEQRVSLLLGDFEAQRTYPARAACRQRTLFNL